MIRLPCLFFWWFSMIAPNTLPSPAGQPARDVVEDDQVALLVFLVVLHDRAEHVAVAGRAEGCLRVGRAVALHPEFGYEAEVPFLVVLHGAAPVPDVPEIGRA